MASKYAIALTDDAKKRVIEWWKANARFDLVNPDALIAEIQRHERFGNDGFFYEMGTFESKDRTPNLYDFTANDYVYEEEEE